MLTKCWHHCCKPHSHDKLLRADRTRHKLQNGSSSFSKSRKPDHGFCPFVSKHVTIASLPHFNWDFFFFNVRTKITFHFQGTFNHLWNCKVTLRAQTTTPHLQPCSDVSNYSLLSLVLRLRGICTTFHVYIPHAHITIAIMSLFSAWLYP